MSPTQRRVLEWLIAYPHVHLTASLDASDVRWSHRWASEQARQHMMAVVPRLGIDASQAEPRTDRLVGGTPRITRPTFAVLNRNGWLRMLGHGEWSATYTISRAGILAVRNLITQSAAS